MTLRPPIRRCRCGGQIGGGSLGLCHGGGLLCIGLSFVGGGGLASDAPPPFAMIGRVHVSSCHLLTRLDPRATLDGFANLTRPLLILQAARGGLLLFLNRELNTLCFRKTEDPAAQSYKVLPSHQWKSQMPDT